MEYLETAHIKLVASNTSSGASVTFFQATGAPQIISVTASNGTTTVDFTACKNSFPAGTNKLRVQRVTPSDNLLTNFANASLLRAEDLNENSQQLLFVLQEQIDAGTGSLPLLATGQYDAGNNQIINVSDGTDNTHAATYGQLSALIGNSSNSASVAQNWEFALGTSGSGVYSAPNTTFVLSPTPASTLDATFIVEVAGVIQRPGTDFTVNGNVLSLLSTNLTTLDFNGTALIIQNFGLARQVFNFPVTGEAGAVDETPVTLKGFAEDDTQAMLSVKDSSNAENANISAAGTIQAKVLQPLNSGTLTVSPTTLTTTGAITSGGDLTVGNFVATQSSGDISANKVTIATTDAASGFNPNMAVPKSYVDSQGLTGTGVGAQDNINTYITPGVYYGTTPASPASYGFPTDVNDGKKYTLVVYPVGASPSDASNHQRVQELHYYQTSSDSRKYIRHHKPDSGSTEWRAWSQIITEELGVNKLATATSTYNMGNNRLLNVGNPLAQNDGDAVNVKFVSDNYTHEKNSIIPISTHTITSASPFYYIDKPAGLTNWRDKYLWIEMVWEDVISEQSSLGNPNSNEHCPGFQLYSSNGANPPVYTRYDGPASTKMSFPLSGSDQQSGGGAQQWFFRQQSESSSTVHDATNGYSGYRSWAIATDKPVSTRVRFYFPQTNTTDAGLRQIWMKTSDTFIRDSGAIVSISERHAYLDMGSGKDLDRIALVGTSNVAWNTQSSRKEIGIASGVIKLYGQRNGTA
tara:strand:+ start:5960 stop:8209 length:2250 start_codon:yes stop_codon:yes gene_type:complete